MEANLCTLIDLCKLKPNKHVVAKDELIGQ